MVPEFGHAGAGLGGGICESKRRLWWKSDQLDMVLDTMGRLVRVGIPGDEVDGRTPRWQQFKISDVGQFFHHCSSGAFYPERPWALILAVMAPIVWKLDHLADRLHRVGSP